MSPERPTSLASPDDAPARTPRWVDALAVASVAAGAALRFAWPADVEFKEDERWMLERALEVSRHGMWPWSGMESSAGLANPGASVWGFAAFARGFRLESAPALSMGVAACAVVALAAGVWLAWRGVEPEAREAWLWGVALAAVSPVAVAVQRKIWAQSLLPLPAVALWWCWMRRDRRGGALGWGALGTLMGQVHMSGFLLAAALAGWTRWRAGGPHPRWRWWWAGTLVAAIPLVPWAIEAVPALVALAAEKATLAGPGVALRAHPWWNVVVPRFWALWASEPAGLLSHPLGEHFTDFLRWPLLGGRPTWLMAAAYAGGSVVLARGIWGARRALAEPARRGTRGTVALLGAALIPFGVLLTLTTLTLHRHYLLTAFPLPLVWFSGLALRGSGRRARTWLVALVVANLTLSVGFLHYIHAHGGAPRGDYGVAWSAQTEGALPPRGR